MVDSSFLAAFNLRHACASGDTRYARRCMLSYATLAQHVWSSTPTFGNPPRFLLLIHCFLPMFYFALSLCFLLIIAVRSHLIVIGS